MNSRRILVTGAAGFIGANFVHFLREGDSPARVVALDALTYAGNLESLAPLQDWESFRFVKADIRDAEALDRIFAEEEFTEIVHFAAESHVDRSIEDPGIFVDVNVRGTFNLLEAARKHGVARYLQVSTDEVYGSLGARGRFTEDSPIRPNSPYAASKAAADHFVRAYRETYGLDTIITRCSNNYGPFQFPEKLIPLMLINCLEKKPLPVYGDGEQVRDWLHVKDHCRALDMILRRGVGGRVYNIGGGNEWRNIDLVRWIADLVDRETGSPPGTSRRLIAFVKDRPGHDRRYAMDASRLQKELGWSCRYDFEGGLKDTVAWYLARKDWWQKIVSGDYREYYEKMYGDR